MNCKKCFIASVLLLSPMMSYSEIQALDDSELGGVTGQAGISIDLSAKVTMGEFRYTDGGSIAVENISIGGANKGTYFGIDWGPGTYSGDMLDGIKMDIDVLNDGDLVIAMKPLPAYGNLVDFGVSTGAWKLMQTNGTSNTTLLSNVNMTGLGSEFRIRIDEATSNLNVKAGFAIDDLDFNVDFLGVGIENAVIAGKGYLENLEAQSYGISDLMIIAELDIYKVAKGLKFDVVQFEADIALPTINIGGASIGSVYVNDLNLQNTSLVVYGHD